MKQLKINTQIFFRTLRHAKSFFLVTVLGLASGLLCTLIVTMLVQSESRFDTFHQNIDTLYQVYLSMDTPDGLWTGNPLPGAVANHLKTQYPEVKRASNFMESEAKVLCNNNAFMSQFAFVHPDFFSMFSFDVIAGNRSTLLTDLRSCVLEEKMAQKLFGKENPIGQTLTIFNTLSFRVDAVVRVPVQSSLQFELLLPYQMLRQGLQDWKGCCTRVFIQLNDGASARDLAPKIVNDYQINAGVDEKEETIGLHLHPFSRYHLYVPGTHHGRITFLYLFIALGAFILIMGCVNFINLSTARATMRSREIGMKKTLGASRRQIQLQFLGESWALTFVSLLLALLGAKLILPFINTLLGGQAQLSFNWAFMALLPVILLITGLMAGGYPAFVLSRLSILSIVKGAQGTKSGRKTDRFRKSLVVLQFCFTIFFLISIYTVYRQTDYLMNSSSGFKKDHVLVMPSNSQAMNDKFEVAKQALLSQPYISAVTRAETSFISQQSSSRISWGNDLKAGQFTVDINDVDSQYADFFGLQLISGRFFRDHNGLDQRESFVITEATVKAMGVSDPIGMRIVFSPDYQEMKREGTVIGVVKDYHTESLHSPIRPKILAMGTPRNWFWYIRYRPDGSKNILEDVKNVIQPILPGELIHLSFFDDKLKSMYETEQTIGKLLTFLTIISIILSVVGLFSLAAFLVDRKKKEIGIRKTLGATGRQIALNFIISQLKGVIWAFLFVAPLSWYFGRKLLENYAYRFDLTIWGVLLTGLMVLALAVVAVAFQAVKASALNPVNVLCHE